MALNPAGIGLIAEPVQISWSSADALLYAIGVGAGTGELSFTTENTSGHPQLVFPTFALAMGYEYRRSALLAAGTFARSKVVLAGQALQMHHPLPVRGTATLRSRLVAMYERSTGSIAVAEVAARLVGLSGESQPLYTSRASLFIRGEVGWGGESGPPATRELVPEREPDHEVLYRTLEAQALIYRLTGDNNPVHSDPVVAAAAGFESPVLHGLCTYGFAARALLHHLCGSDPARFTSIDARFAAPVFPGDTLEIRIWGMDRGTAVFTASVGDRVVLSSGKFRHT